MPRSTGSSEARARNRIGRRCPRDHGGLNRDLRSSRPAHVYVLNEDAGGDLHVLFPLRGLDLANPLPANARVRLPGSNGGRELSWEIAGSGQREEFLVVLASAPLAPIQRLVDSAAVALDVERGVSRVHVEAPAGLTLRGAHLNAFSRNSGRIFATPIVHGFRRTASMIRAAPRADRNGCCLPACRSAR